MVYEKKRNNPKLYVRFFIIGVVVFCFCVIGVYQVYRKEQPTTEIYTICGFSKNKTIEKFQEVIREDTYEVSDYLYYGETLSLFHTPYDVEKKDDLSGKTLTLHNLCNDTSYTFPVDQEVDRQIQLAELEEGFYSIEVSDRLVNKQVVYQEDMKSEEFETLVRNQETYGITLESSKNHVEEYGLGEDRGLYIEVKRQRPKEDQIDILIDPYGNNIDETMLPDVGSTTNGLNENIDMYEAAILLKEQFEAAGLRVEITKNDASEIVESYGKTGRFSKGYQKQAKYYLQLAYNHAENEEVRGFEMVYSSKASPNFVNAIAYGMKNHLPQGMEFANETSSSYGIQQSLILPGQDDRYVYDMNMYIREVGGKATQAGMFSELSEGKNGGFAKNQTFGMYGLSIYFIYDSNTEDVSAWKLHKEELVQAFGHSFLESLNIEGK